MIISRAKDNNYTTELTVAENSQIRPVYSGQPVENGGTGTDFRPSQLVLAGYVSCMSVNLRHALIQDKVAFDDVIISADMDNEEEGISKIYTKIEIIADISDEKKQEYIEKSKNCYVKTILSNEKQFFEMK